MKKMLSVLMLSATLGFGASLASAGPINVGGVVWDPDSGLDFVVQALQMRETSVAAVGDELSGAGRVGQINGDQDNFCPGCNLTFTFSGYLVQDIVGSQLAFSGGTVQFYVDNTSSFSQLDTSTWGIGDEWLTLVGVEHIRGTFFGGSVQATLFSNITGTIDAPEAGSDGFGLLDVAGGIAAPYIVRDQFITGIGGFADLSLSSEFQTDDALESHPIQGSATIRGETQRIPEPSMLVLLGTGLLFLALVGTRRRGNRSGNMEA